MSLQALLNFQASQRAKQLLEIIIFNVGAGQAILAYPIADPDHAMLIDCGGEENGFSFIPFLQVGNLLPTLWGRLKIGCLALTNLDHDHFCRLPDLMRYFHIENACLPKNISSYELKKHKLEETNALKTLCYLMDTYTQPAHAFDPPYLINSDHLYPSDFDGKINTNWLSQIMFLEFYGSKICIAGDLEYPAWDKLLQRDTIKNHLRTTNILIAAHHGRENGYHPDIFNYCRPDVVIISDKEIMHGTQDGMAQQYAAHVKSDGILFDGQRRKVLTTRRDGHISIVCDAYGKRNYSKKRC